MKTIPKIFHLTGKKKENPAIYDQCLTQLRNLHPDWSICIYDDNESRGIISAHLPELLPVYDAYSTAIQRTDVFRIAVIYLYGGFYLDQDVFCLKALDTLCNFEIVLGEELTLTEDECELSNQNDLRIANYMFGSVPKHTFWLELLKEMALKSPTPVKCENDVLAITGPGLFTDFYHQKKQFYPSIVLLKNNDRICQRKCGKVSCHFGDFGIHYHTGSWRWEHKIKSVTYTPEKVARSDIRNAVEKLETRINSYPESIVRNIFILGTYDVEQGFYDGLTHVFKRVLDIGKVISDTSSIEGAKVLTCGIPHAYETKLSPKNRNIIYTTFESSRLPSFWVKSINKYYHYCIVPHNEIKTVFLNSGVNIPLFVIHQGFNRYKRCWQRRSPEIQTNFRVGFLGVPVNRKNLVKLYAACKKLQETNIPEIKLAIHVPVFYDWLDERIFSEIKNDPLTEWTTGKFNNDQISDWYNNLSCYIFPSSGEGWSFTPRESLYLGVPTIISNIPVHRELAESNFCKVIDHQEEENVNFNGHDWGQWARIEGDDIADAVLEVYENYQHYTQLALQGAQWIEDKWFNEEVQQQLVKLIKSL